jgi:DNA gyrase/topoisomerase IV subunit B
MPVRGTGGTGDQLKETTMDAKTRSMLMVTLPSAYDDRQPVKDLVERLMGGTRRTGSSLFRAGRPPLRMTPWMPDL